MASSTEQIYTDGHERLQFIPTGHKSAESIAYCFAPFVWSSICLPCCSQVGKVGQRPYLKTHFTRATFRISSPVWRCRRCDVRAAVIASHRIPSSASLYHYRANWESERYGSGSRITIYLTAALEDFIWLLTFVSVLKMKMRWNGGSCSLAFSVLGSPGFPSGAMWRQTVLCWKSLWFLSFATWIMDHPCEPIQPSSFLKDLLENARASPGQLYFKYISLNISSSFVVEYTFLCSVPLDSGECHLSCRCQATGAARFAGAEGWREWWCRWQCVERCEYSIGQFPLEEQRRETLSEGDGTPVVWIAVVWLIVVFPSWLEWKVFGQSSTTSVLVDQLFQGFVLTLHLSFSVFITLSVPCLYVSSIRRSIFPSWLEWKMIVQSLTTSVLIGQLFKGFVLPLY